MKKHAKQLRIGYFSTQEKESQSTVNHPIAQMEELQDKVNSLSNSMELYDSLRIFRVFVEMISRHSCLSHDTRNSMGTSGNIFESLPARGEPSSAFFKIPCNLTSPCEWRPCDTGKIVGEAVKREPQGSSVSTLSFCKEFWVIPRSKNSESSWNDKPRFLLAELIRHLRKRF